MKRAVYAGSFDPPTNGHLHVIGLGAELFDELVVVIAQNSDKAGKNMFTVEERLSMLRQTTKTFSNVRVQSCIDQYVVSYAHDINAGWLFRGMRSADDAKAELALNDLNSTICQEVKTVIAPTDTDYSRVSSSNVKALMGPPGWEDVVRKFVPKHILEELIKKHQGV